MRASPAPRSRSSRYRARAVEGWARPESAMWTGPWRATFGTPGTRRGGRAGPGPCGSICARSQRAHVRGRHGAACRRLVHVARWDPGAPFRSLCRERRRPPGHAGVRVLLRADPPRPPPAGRRALEGRSVVVAGSQPLERRVPLVAGHARRTRAVRRRHGAVRPDRLEEPDRRDQYGGPGPHPSICRWAVSRRRRPAGPWCGRSSTTAPGTPNSPTATTTCTWRCPDPRTANTTVADASPPATASARCRLPSPWSPKAASRRRCGR